MAGMYILVLFPLVLLLGWNLLVKPRIYRHHLPQFSGPKGFPFLGNIFQLGNEQWLKYTDWHKTFGPIYKLNFAGQSVLVVGSARIAADLLDRRSSIYSDRPRFVMATEILTGGMNLAFARYGDRWRRMRRAASQGLSPRATRDYTPLQEKEVVNLLAGLLEEKGQVDPHLRRTAAATVLSVVYAYPPISIGDPLVRRVEDYVDRMLKAALPGNYLVDIFPVMMYLPRWMAKWKREGYRYYKKDTELFMGLMEDVNTGLANGSRSECFASKLLDPLEPHGLDSTEAAWLAGMMFGAGAEAMAATLSVFLLAMLLYPRVQSKLHDELLSAIGEGRLPTFEDAIKLPYLNAVIKETLRWRPMGPLAVPHMSTQDDVYAGHFIPAGTIILPNVWAMHHDEAVYQNPDEFRPERYLADDGVTAVEFPEAKELGQHSFGFGRRSCIGYTVAVNALLINAANIVTVFSITQATTESGDKITPDPDALIDEGLAVRPVPFECCLTARSDILVEIIRSRSACQ